MWPARAYPSKLHDFGPRVTLLAVMTSVRKAVVRWRRNESMFSGQESADRTFLSKVCDDPIFQPPNQAPRSVDLKSRAAVCRAVKAL